jgi:hypothetical protein
VCGRVTELQPQIFVTNDLLTFSDTLLDSLELKQPLVNMENEFLKLVTLY